MNSTLKSVLLMIPFLVAAWFFQKSHDESIELSRRTESALHTAEVQLARALANGTDPRQLIESCARITGVACESNGDTVKMSFFPDESREKPYESRVWRVDGRNLKFIGLAE